MKNRINIIVMATLIIMAGLVWAVARSQRNMIKTIATAPVTTIETPQPAKTQIVIVPVPQTIHREAAVATQEPGDEVTRVRADDSTRHTAQPGETVTSLAADLLGKDTKTNRDAIVNANPSLQADPDKLIAGKTYHIPPASEIPVVEVAPGVAAPPAVVEAVRPEPVKVLKYTAAPGDTVSNMAGAFLGSDNKAHQDAIVSANPTLQANPDHVVAGKTYHIPAPDGLSTSGAPLPAEGSARPTTQPDADQVVLASSPRTLRYTARPGDTVTTIAIELLGSDTQETRDAIINNNPELKRDPDRVVAGQTYWIPAPTASIQNP